MRTRFLVFVSVSLVVFCGVFALGMRMGEEHGDNQQPDRLATAEYSSGYHDRDFYETAYAWAAEAAPLPEASAALSAHHMAIPGEIARVFEALKSHDGQTVVLVSPNHFGRGFAQAQVSAENWDTPYGVLETDDAGALKLVGDLDFLAHDEVAFPFEHGISGLTPFVKKSLPHSKVISIILKESLTQEQAWDLGQEIANELPDAVVVASVDMVHESPESVVKEVDPKIVKTLEGGCASVKCFENYPIDSNASLRTLLSFANAKHFTFFLSHEGSSMSLGLTKDVSENVSHILGVLY